MLILYSYSFSFKSFLNSSALEFISYNFFSNCLISTFYFFSSSINSIFNWSFSYYSWSISTFSKFSFLSSCIWFFFFLISVSSSLVYFLFSSSIILILSICYFLVSLSFLTVFSSFLTFSFHTLNSSTKFLILLWFSVSLVSLSSALP